MNFRPTKKKTNSIAAALGLLIAASASYGQSVDRSKSPDSSTHSPRAPAANVVARVGGTPILSDDVDRAIAAAARGQKIDPAALTTAQANVLAQLVDVTLLRNYLTDEKLLASNDEIDAAIDRLRSVVRQQNSTFSDYLARNNTTEPALRAELVIKLGWKKFLDRNATDENLQKFFDIYHEVFDGTKRRVSHILLRPETPPDDAKIKLLVEDAGKLRERINTGDITFEAAAEKYSAGPSRHQGGDLGFIPHDGVMVEPFSDAAFTTKRGEVSTPVLTAFGVHLIKVTDVKPGTRTLQDVREALLPAFSQYLMSNLVKELHDKVKIEFAPGFPHFKPGTTELEGSTPGGQQTGK